MAKKKKKKIDIKIIFIIGLIVLCLIIGLILFINNDKKKNNTVLEKSNIKESVTIKIGDTLPIIDEFFDGEFEKTSATILWDLHEGFDDEKIANTAGEYEATITYKDVKYNVILKVIDDEFPVITNEKDLETTVGSEIDLIKNINVTDNSSDEIEVIVTGDYDFNKTGEYNLKYVACDKSNNCCEKDFKLTVKDKPVINTTTTETSKKEVPLTTTKGYTVEVKDGIYYINGILIANKTYTLPSTYNPGGLLSEFNDNFSVMKSAASNEDITLNVISGYRSYSKQQSTYNNWVNTYGKEKADTVSARPGHSEHQSGLAADIKSLNQSFSNTSEGIWLNNNCYKYGFIIRYPKGKESITGYIFEPWHIRYVGVDLATTLYNNGDWITLEEYFGIDSEY